MATITQVLEYIKIAEENLRQAKALLEKSDANNLFHALKQVEFAKDTLSDAREVMAKIYFTAECLNK